MEKEGLSSQRMPASQSGFKSYLIRAVVLMYHLSASLGRRPQSRTAQRGGCGGNARSIRRRRERPGKAGAPRRLKWMLFRRSTCAVALPVPGSAQRAELLSSETSNEACKHGARTGLGEGARSSLAQSANYIIGTKKRISLGLV